MDFKLISRHFNTFNDCEGIEDTNGTQWVVLRSEISLTNL